MPKRHSSDDIIKSLQRNGFIVVSQRGSHIKLKKIGINETKIVIVPANRKEIPVGTFLSIVSQSGMSKIEFK